MQQFRAWGVHRVAIDHAGRVAFRMDVVKREAPRTLAVAGAAFGLITVMNSLVGPPMPRAVLGVNIVAALLLIGAALIVRRPDFPVAVTPWILAVGALILVLIGQVQVWISPDDVGFVYIVLIMVLYPLLTMCWIPAATVALPMLMGCVVIAAGQYGLAAADWVIASIAALSIGMALLWLRLRSADELAEKTALIGQLATRDQLTGVLNRHGIEERIPELVALAVRHRESVFAVFADVDGLKVVNDTFGHGCGDAVLVATADAIRETVRAADLVGRWGGDEFIVLGMGRGEHADELRDRVRQSIDRGAIEPTIWPGGVSIGMATASLRELDVEALIRRADTDMYTRRGQRRALERIVEAS